ncbi:MAG: 3-dehydroquinate synthase [Bdellovibrionales bacterium]|nr:3-dehydroquinate synthase [Bdellovibrionales bacterium]
MKKSQVKRFRKLPSANRLSEILVGKPEKYLVIYDSRLEKNPSFKAWLAKFNYKYKVKAGESLKNLESFPGHIKKIFKLVSPFSSKSLCVLAVGGGSVGDFAGFAASVIKRGVPLIHIPTTLLAAMDSAHGGKTALNISDFKNQVGSFYPAEAVILTKEFFETLPLEQIHSSLGELVKMALIQGGSLLERVNLSEALDINFIWEVLPQVIEEKNNWVAKDPFEKTGDRQVLNLGHTFGHVLEGHYGIPHGLAVGEGLIFSCLWSHHRGYMNLKDRDDTLSLLNDKLGFLSPIEFSKRHGKISESRLLKFVFEDKKLVNAKSLNFVFLDKAGGPFVKKVSVQSFVTESQRQGWTRT